jgi:hypothetical protein
MIKCDKCYKDFKNIELLDISLYGFDIHYVCPTCYIALIKERDTNKESGEK